MLHWQPAKIPDGTFLSGRYCTLEPIHAKHSQDLYDVLRIDDTVWRYLPYGPFNNYEAFHEWLMSFKDDPFFYAIIDKSHHRPTGLASYLNIIPEHGTIEVGHLLYSHLLKKTRVATEAMYLMMYHAFENMKYRRYEWKCNANNLASRKAAERLGFKFEGIFRQHKIHKNENRDTVWLSIIDSEWPELKNGLEKWLLPENFHQDGKQKIALR